MEITNFAALRETQLTQAAQMLSDELPEGWPTLADAVEEISDLLNDHEAQLLAAVEKDEVIGWAGVHPGFGKMFELHPLVVRHDRQRKGVGTLLLNEITRAAKDRGALTLLAGSGDEKPDGETSLANVNLYEDLPGKLAAFAPGTHQTAFYLKRGFRVVGVVPDAYGIGQPDIQMAKALYL